MKPWQEAMAHYAPGGGYGKGVEAGLTRGKKKALSSGMQSLVSSGMAGTTMAAGLGGKYEEEVAAPTRAGVESTRAQAIAGLKVGMAGALQSSSEAAANRSLQLRMANMQNRLGYAGLRSRSSGGGGEQTSPQQNRRTQLPTHEERIPSPYGTASGGNGGYRSPTPSPAGQPMYGASGTGMYLGGGQSLRPDQVDFKSSAHSSKYTDADLLRIARGG